MTEQTHTDEELLQLLQNNSERAIEIIFRRYFTEMVRAANRLLQDENMAKDVVQDVFYKFWNNRDRLNIKSTIRGYLKRSSVNAALDYLRKKQNFKVVDTEEALIQQASKSDDAVQLLEGEELQKKVNAAIQTLHPRCRTVFLLSRHDQLTYRQISEKLDISVKTVESHMSTALKHLRRELEPFLTLLLLLLA